MDRAQALNQQNLKRPALCFSAERKHFKSESFQKRCHVNHSSARVLPKRKFKVTGDRWVLKFLRHCVHGKHSVMRFQSAKSLFSNSFRVEGTKKKEKSVYRDARISEGTRYMQQ